MLFARSLLGKELAHEASRRVVLTASREVRVRTCSGVGVHRAGRGLEDLAPVLVVPGDGGQLRSVAEGLLALDGKTTLVVGHGRAVPAFGRRARDPLPHLLHGSVRSYVVVLVRPSGSTTLVMRCAGSYSKRLTKRMPARQGSAVDGGAVGPWTHCGHEVTGQVEAPERAPRRSSGRPVLADRDRSVQDVVLGDQLVVLGCGVHALGVRGADLSTGGVVDVPVLLALGVDGRVGSRDEHGTVQAVVGDDRGRRGVRVRRSGLVAEDRQQVADRVVVRVELGHGPRQLAADRPGRLGSAPAYQASELVEVEVGAVRARVAARVRLVLGVLLPHRSAVVVVPERRDRSDGVGHLRHQPTCGWTRRSCAPLPAGVCAVTRPAVDVPGAPEA